MAKPTSNESNLVLLESLIRNWEDETIEFKEASNDFDTDKIGRYVSALSNEANLSDEPSAWLVFGVRNKTRKSSARATGQTRIALTVSKGRSTTAPIPA